MTEPIGVYTVRNDAYEIATLPGAGSRPLLVRDPEPRTLVSALTAHGRASELVIDHGYWRNVVATPAKPSAGVGAGGLFAAHLDEWVGSVLTRSGTAKVLSPSYFVQAGDWAALDALVSALMTVSDPRLVPFIATDAVMMGSANISRFRRALAPLDGRPIALLFAAKYRPLTSKPALTALRTVLAAHPGAWLVGVEPLVALDAIAHGAGRVFVGTSSTQRFPRVPGCGGGGFNAAGFVPGLLHSELLEMRSPMIYADWYISTRAPRCTICKAPVDSFSATDQSKKAIRDHNIHAMSAVYTAMTAMAPGSLQLSAHKHRLSGLLAHTALLPRVPVTEFDTTLRNLMRIDARTLPIPPAVRALI
ncbi:hypothetical protein [Luteipulveratus mongoliensis]|uniref:Uncharacterized protein n=1 Tax=Luteipulveratus mongoliensis TaxID=571913 RepID=A0A0K1JDX3_9MICO|nr:hypothetical protein [Luteipulveratus mongoliensis]AKU14917.1 hypothetical protein VV02_01960 [Luteipulveratus mongoliensis]